MKRTLLSLLLLASLLACEHREAPEEAQQEKPAAPRLAAQPMSLHQAVTVAVQSAEGLLGSGVRPVGVTPFLSARTRGDDGLRDTLLLAVHLAGGGLTFIDQRLEPQDAVLCVLPTTNAIDSVPPPAQFLIEAMSAMALSTADSLNSGASEGDTLPQGKAVRANKRPPESAHFPPNGDVMPIDGWSPPENDYTVSTSTTSEYGPYLKTNWGQRSYGINKYCTYKGKLCPVGCTPLAIAQLLAFHRLPSYIPWDGVLASNRLPAEYADLVARLLRDIGKVAWVTYRPDASSTIDGRIVPTLCEFGLKCDGRTQYSYEAEQDLICGRPVIMTGSTEDQGMLGYAFEGHAWVVDGVRLIKQCVNRYNGNGYLLESTCSTTIFMHANMGWDGTGNGWYRMNYFDTREGTYQYYLRYYTGIRP